MTQVDPKFKFGLLTTVNLCNKVLQKNNILLAYTHNKNNEAFIRLENDGFRKENPNWSDYKSLWDSLSFNYVSIVNPTTKVGFEVTFILLLGCPQSCR